MAVFLSGIHSGPAEAHENDPVHTTTHHVEQQDDGSKQPTDVDQHGCHHHCPSAAAPFAGLLASADFLTGTRFQPAKMVPLTSTTLTDALDGADVFVGVSKARLVTGEMLKKMAKDPIVFAMANPDRSEERRVGKECVSRCRYWGG